MQNYKTSSTILRLTKVLTSSTKIIKEWKEKAKSKRTIFAFNDKYVSPIDLDSIFDVIEKIIKYKSNGLYHLGGEESLTYYELCKKLFNSDVSILKLIEPEISNSLSPHGSLKTYLPK